MGLSDEKIFLCRIVVMRACVFFFGVDVVGKVEDVIVGKVEDVIVHVHPSSQNCLLPFRICNCVVQCVMFT